MANILSDAEKVKQYLLVHGHKNVDDRTLLEMLESFGEDRDTHSVVRLLLGDSGFHDQEEDLENSTSDKNYLPKVQEEIPSSTSDKTCLQKAITSSKQEAWETKTKTKSKESTKEVRDEPNAFNILNQIPSNKESSKATHEIPIECSSSTSDDDFNNDIYELASSFYGSDDNSYYLEPSEAASVSDNEETKEPFIMLNTFQKRTSPIGGIEESSISRENEALPVDMIEENNNDPNNNLDPIQMLNQDEEDSLHRSIDSIELIDVDQMSANNPQPGCSKDSVFIENSSDDFSSLSRKYNSKHSKSIVEEASMIGQLLPRISLSLIYLHLLNNRHARNRIEITLWDVLPRKRPHPIPHRKRYSHEDLCPLKSKKSSEKPSSLKKSENSLSQSDSLNLASLFDTDASKNEGKKETSIKAGQYQAKKIILRKSKFLDGVGTAQSSKDNCEYAKDNCEVINLSPLLPEDEKIQQEARKQEACPLREMERTEQSKHQRQTKKVILKKSKFKNLERTTDVNLLKYNGKSASMTDSVTEEGQRNTAIQSMVETTSQEPGDKVNVEVLNNVSSLVPVVINNSTPDSVHREPAIITKSDNVRAATSVSSQNEIRESVASFFCDNRNLVASTPISNTVSEVTAHGSTFWDSRKMDSNLTMNVTNETSAQPLDNYYRLSEKGDGVVTRKEKTSIYHFIHAIKPHNSTPVADRRIGNNSTSSVTYNKSSPPSVNYHRLNKSGSFPSSHWNDGPSSSANVYREAGNGNGNGNPSTLTIKAAGNWNHGPSTSSANAHRGAGNGNGNGNGNPSTLTIKAAGNWNNGPSTSSANAHREAGNGNPTTWTIKAAGNWNDGPSSSSANAYREAGTGNGNGNGNPTTWTIKAAGNWNDGPSTSSANAYREAGTGNGNGNGIPTTWTIKAAGNSVRTSQLGAPSEKVAHNHQRKRTFHFGATSNAGNTGNSVTQKVPIGPQLMGSVVPTNDMTSEVEVLSASDQLGAPSEKIAHNRQRKQTFHLGATSKAGNTGNSVTQKVPTGPQLKESAVPTNDMTSEVEVLSASELKKIEDMRKSVYRQLTSIFTDVDRDFLHELCKRELNRSGLSEWGSLERLVEYLLVEGEHHPRVITVDPDPPQYNVDEQYENLLEIFPNADPNYLRSVAEKMYNQPEKAQAYVQSMLENPDYPTKDECLKKIKINEQQKQYTMDFDVAQFLEIFPDPFKHFEDPQRTCKYSVAGFEFLKGYFNKIKINTISKIYSASKFHLTNTAEQLELLSPNMKTCRPYRITPTEDIPLLQEMAFIRHKSSIKNLLEIRRTKEQEEFQRLKDSNELLECQCCFNDECMPSKCATCDNGHIFCHSCIVHGTEITMAEGETRIKCFTECDGEFIISTLQEVLKPTKFSILLQKRQAAEVMAASLEGLVSCPFCHFASIPPPEDKVFKCYNPECMKESCRLCKELNHVPYGCHERSKLEDARHHLEESMTRALIRNCYKCQRPFFKEEGCNKMQCPCGAMMCYICNKPVKDYTHFNAQGAERIDLCPLWSDNKRLNAETVLKAAEVTQKKLQTKDSNLKLNAEELLPTLPPASAGPHEQIANAHVLPQHVQEEMEPR
ncbi:hyphally regulated cell wall protein 3 [Orussus abietinus]|uniref:hyphally regulated cell wall protein 3 n=1 Tax=Orussus abietinus TaxID=222816 RepID=UPI0006261D9F|nr:hyphally regulated cell wall protein 3 [Orussus abietinus]XP_012288794.1 hyphally regulated cell wall protein 3 [Orussus abietinus]